MKNDSTSFQLSEESFTVKNSLYSWQQTLNTSYIRNLFNSRLQIKTTKDKSSDVDLQWSNERDLQS